MTSERSAYGRFRHALKAGNLVLVRAAAAELPIVSLSDALRVCLLVRDREPERCERAAIRWLGRFALEARSASPADVRAAADALARLPAEPDDAMADLQHVCLATGIGR